MKSILKVTAMACLLATTTSVIAAPAPLTLEIKGKIKPGTCTPTFISGSDVINFGTILSSELDRPVTGGSATVNVTCDGNQKLAFYITDTKADSLASNAIPGSSFGLGKTASGVNIGSYTLEIKHLELDTNSLPLLSDDGKTWTQTTGDILANPQNGWVSVGDSSDVPVGGKVLNFELHPKLTFDSNNDELRNSTDEIDLDGAAVINFVYL